MYLKWNTKNLPPHYFYDEIGPKSIIKLMYLNVYSNKLHHNKQVRVIAYYLLCLPVDQSGYHKQQSFMLLFGNKNKNIYIGNRSKFAICENISLQSTTHPFKVDICNFKIQTYYWCWLKENNQNLNSIIL